MSSEPTMSQSATSGQPASAVTPRPDDGPSAQELNAEGLTIVLVTHDPEVVGHARRIIRIRDGRIEGSAPKRPKAAAPSASPGQAASAARASRREG